jgi:hypothetical protein
VIGTSVFAVIIAVASIFVFKFYSQREPMASALTVMGFNFGSILVSLGNAVQIQVMGSIYSNIALKLNIAENHRTDTEYEDQLILKTFVFQFINSFASLFYIAFIKKYVEGECLGTCLAELSTALSTIFLTRLVSGNINAIVMAAINFDKKLKADMAGCPPGIFLTPAEREFSMENYDVLMSTFVNYADLAMQYGYATLFAAAFPLAPIMACLNNYIKIR